MHQTLDRSFLWLHGPDTLPFLQGLVTQDVFLLQPGKLLYSLMLTPQGRFLFDFFLFSHEGGVVIDCARPVHDDLKKRLTLYKLRKALTIQTLESWGATAWKDKPQTENLCFPDPRCPELGWRCYGEKTPESNASHDWDYRAHAMDLGVPHGFDDLIQEKSIPMECHMEALGALNFTKGCYLGQELTARTKHTGEVRKTLISGMAKEDITVGENLFVGHPGEARQKLGRIQSVYQKRFFARVSLDILKNAPTYPKGLVQTEVGNTVELNALFKGTF